jgi:hypothetical protein
MKFLQDETGATVRQKGRFLPCPFCGAADDIEVDRHSLAMGVPPFKNDFFVHCDRCDATGPDSINEMTAVRRWNNRDKRNATRPTKKRAATAPECAGCGFAHAADYKDCVWLKNPY